ncbi:MAG: hypothetical protein ACXVQX_08500 [Actinomycetota bacterium]
MEPDELENRLRRIGSEPLDPTTEDRMLAGVRSARRRVAMRRRAKIAGVAVAVLLLGTGGLASAGVLPAPVQSAAHTVMGAVGIHVPPGHDRYNNPKDCPGGPYKNHGQYVRSHKGDPNAGQSNCGKPLVSLSHSPEPKESAETKKSSSSPKPKASAKPSSSAVVSPTPSPTPSISVSPSVSSSGS